MGLVRVDRGRVDPRFFIYQYISGFPRFIGGPFSGLLTQ